MQIGRKLRYVISIGVMTSALASAVPSPALAGATARTGTITFAEAAGANPNYIFPYMNCAYFSTNNINQFQQLMFRPLYWFGLAGSSAYVPSLSPAYAPVFSHANKTLTIRLKGWKFADGQTVNARSVMFFLNLYSADPTSYCGYTAKSGIPDQVKSAAGHGNTVKINFTTSVNPNWILYNYLSEITPMPDSWDNAGHASRAKCATGKYGASSTKAACLNVEHRLDALSARTSSYTGAMWQGGVDGPWRLTSFDGAGNATFRPNPRYSGPQKAMVRVVREVAFTSIPAEENQLQEGTIDIGYVDLSTLTSPAPRPGVAGPNWGQLSGRYDLYSGSTWAFNYAPFNFSAADPKAAAIAQLYIRQALQMSVDQSGIIASVDKGYGFPIYSPQPPNTPRSIGGNVANPYPYSLTAAKALLTSHGWTMQSGVMTCTSPGTGANQCGANIALGYTLNLKMVWTSGSATLDAVFNKEIADWASIGVVVTHTTDTTNNVISDCGGGAGYEICSWGNGWNYSPAYYPSGERLFTPAGDFNVGSYVDPKMTSLIDGTIHGGTHLLLYATYAAQQLPVLFQPLQANAVEIVKTLKSSVGFTPNPLGNFMPEYLHF